VDNILAKNIAINHGKTKSTASTRPATPIRCEVERKPPDGRRAIGSSTPSRADAQPKFVLRKAFANKTAHRRDDSTRSTGPTLAPTVPQRGLDCFVDIGAGPSFSSTSSTSSLRAKGGFASQRPPRDFRRRKPLLDS